MNKKTQKLINFLVTHIESLEKQNEDLLNIISTRVKEIRRLNKEIEDRTGSRVMNEIKAMEEPAARVICLGEKDGNDLV